MIKILLATSNQGKAREIKTIFAQKLPQIQLLSANELDNTRHLDPEETGTTCAENAELKARIFAQASGLPTLADDSGLFVAALGGFPGVKTARWREPDQPARNLGLIELLNLRLAGTALIIPQMVEFPPPSSSLPPPPPDCPRRATFISTISFVDPRSHSQSSFISSSTHNSISAPPFTHTVIGALTGSIVASPDEIRGNYGFGYDPIFCPDCCSGLTNAELTPEHKNSISHRSIAINKIIAFLIEYFKLNSSL